MRKILKSENQAFKQKKAGRQHQQTQNKQSQINVYYATVHGQQFVIPLNKASDKQIQNSRQQHLNKIARRRNKVVQLGQLGIEAMGWVCIIIILALVVDDICHFQGFFLVSVFVIVCIPVLILTAHWIRKRLR